MALFSSKHICAVCGRECAPNKFQLVDKSWLCHRCHREAGLLVSDISPKSLSVADVKEMLEEKRTNERRYSNFKATRSVGDYLKVDDVRKLWYIPSQGLIKIGTPNVYSYEEVLDFELLEDGGSITKGGIGSAVTGGILFGGIGAVVGGIAGKRSSKPTCTSLKVKITLRNRNESVVYINLISTEIKKSSLIYKTCEKQAQEIISILQIICEECSKTTDVRVETATVSSADEILKYKQLLDAGIITQDEFDAKKRSSC